MCDAEFMVQLGELVRRPLADRERPAYLQRAPVVDGGGAQSMRSNSNSSLFSTLWATRPYAVVGLTASHEERRSNIQRAKVKHMRSVHCSHRLCFSSLMSFRSPFPIPVQINQISIWRT